jgi:hypothetical protein
MSSFISGFKAVIAASAAIFLVEAAVFAARPSSFVQRSNYLDWNYATPEIFHKAMIYQKLDHFARSAPDVIQVGDSSGLHGVNPEVAMKYLSGLKYVNLSSIANAGFDGQYAIADFMFRRNRSIKALVLYVTLNQLPKVDMIGGDQNTGGSERIRDSFTAPWAYFNPPSMVYRRRVTEAVYSRWGAVRARERHFFEAGETFSDMLDSIQQHFGWWPEHDPRFAGAKLRDYWRQFCDDAGTRVLDDTDAYYLYDPLLGKRSYVHAYLQRFADLAANHGAKLVIIFNPYPCRKLEGDFLAARRADLEAVKDANSNVAYGPLFEPWPMSAFIAGDHLRAEYVDINSERVGRFLAEALGIRDIPPGQVGPPVEAQIPPVAANPRSLFAPPKHAAAKADGASVSPWTEGEGIAPTSVKVVEGAGYGEHLVKIELDELRARSPYLLSAIVKPIRLRGLRLETFDPDSDINRGSVQCSMHELQAFRGANTLDAGLDVLSDEWMRCWFVPAFTASTATLNLVILNEGGQRAYAGDGTSGMLVKDVTIQRWRLP